MVPPHGTTAEPQHEEALTHFEGGLNSARGVIIVGGRIAEEGHNSVTDLLVERPVVLEHYVGHFREVLVQLLRQLFRLEALG